MSQENVELVRGINEYFNQHGEPPWELLADDLQVRNLPDAPWQPSPGVKGMHEWIDFANEVAEEWRVEVDEYEDLGADRVLQLGRLWMKFRATGIEGEVPLAQVLTFEDGKVKRVDSQYTREQALEAARLRDSRD